MRPKLSFAWFLISVALAAVLVVQWRTARDQNLLLEKLQLQVEKLDGQEKAARARIHELESERMQLRAELRATETELNGARLAYGASVQAAAGRAAVAAPAAMAPRQDAEPAPENLGGMLAQMLKDPEMRKAMEHQQRIGLDLVYGTLVKRLQLSPEQEKQFMEVLLEQQMANISQAGTMFNGATNRIEMAQKLGEERQAREERIKALLGDEKFQRYQDYNQTLGERMMLEQFARQAEIQPEQTEQLLAIMREEKKNLQVNRGVSPPEPVADPLRALQSPEAIERALADQEQVNHRVLERAGQVLTPEQVQKLGPVLKAQIDMQKLGLKMARQMFGGASQQAPSPPPAPVPER